MKRLLTRSLAYWGILAVEATNKNQVDSQEDDSHLQRVARGATIRFALHGYRASVHVSTGATPLHPPI